MTIHKREGATKQDPAGAWLESMAWPEAEQALQRYRTILLPLGARTKQHGLHLPLNTDWLQAEYLARRLVELRPLLALPTLAYGHYPAFLDYPGSVSLGMGPFRDSIVDICCSLDGGAGHRFYVLNTGISTLPGLESARGVLAQRSLTLAYSNFATLMKDVDRELETQARGSHADELETSVMLYIAPDQVRLERAVPETRERAGPGPFCREPAVGCGLVSPSGAWGDPTAATREKGEVWVEELLRRLCIEVDRLQ